MKTDVALVLQPQLPERNRTSERLGNICNISQTKRVVLIIMGCIKLLD